MTGADELGGKLLEAVSRSFYLTLKALPQGLREPLSLAYLLARTADTMADTATVAGAIKLECLAEFGRLIQENAENRAGEQSLAGRLNTEFVPHQEDLHEAELLRRLPELLQAFRLSPPSQIKSIQHVLKPIVHGQMLDIERFPTDGSLRALATSGELDEYTYLVAGCVGEFWTTISLEESAGAFLPEASQAQLIEWGIRYGRGLQLINILRDVGKDAGMGRCYLPESEIIAHGLTLEDVQKSPALLQPLMAPWLKLAHEHLECGLLYLEAVKLKRLRYAAALPLLLGLRTLSLVEKADAVALLRGVKVSRGEVGRILVEAGVASLRSGGIRRMAEKMLR